MPAIRAEQGNRRKEKKDNKQLTTRVTVVLWGPNRTSMWEHTKLKRANGSFTARATLHFVVELNSPGSRKCCAAAYTSLAISAALLPPQFKQYLCMANTLQWSAWLYNAESWARSSGECMRESSANSSNTLNLWKSIWIWEIHIKYMYMHTLINMRMRRMIAFNCKENLFHQNMVSFHLLSNIIKGRKRTTHSGLRSLPTWPGSGGGQQNKL